MANTALPVAELDFDTLKTNFKTFLNDQAVFNDFDFEGSNLGVLIDLLAYNAHQMGFYTNMAFSEMFLDSALLRDSVLSHAKELNYVPRSRRSASAFINVTVDSANTDPDAVVMPKGSEFRTLVDGRAFTFTTPAAVNFVDSGNGLFTAANTEIFEGKFVTDFFEVDTSVTDQKFLLQNKQIDTSSLTVNIQTSNTDNSNTDWLAATSLLDANQNSEVFFIQAADDDKYELIFGDDITSKALVNQNLVKATYRVSSTDLASGADTFKSAGNIAGFSNVVVTTASSALGGSEREDLASIKLNAPRFFQAQERAVTSSDYKTILQIEFPEIQAIAVFGGENLNPPKFGEVAISVDLRDADGIPASKKAAIETFLQVRAPISITPVVIDPEFLFLEIVSDVKYNINVTTQTPNDIEAAVSSALTTYNTSDLNDFEITMKYSRLVAVIDDASSSIVSNDTQVRGFVKLAPTDLTTPLTQHVAFENTLAQGIAIEETSDFSLYTPVIRSSAFIRNGSSMFLEDNGLGILQGVTTDSSGARQVVVGNQGTVNYSTGDVNINALTIDSFSGDGIRLFARFEDRDIVAKKNKIIAVESDATQLNIIPVRE